MTDTKPFTDGDTDRDGSQLRIEDDGHGGLRVEIHSEQRIAPHVMTPTGKNELRRWLFSEGRLLTKEDAAALETLNRDQWSTIREIAIKLNDHRVSGGDVVVRVSRLCAKVHRHEAEKADMRRQWKEYKSEIHEAVRLADVTHAGTLLQRVRHVARLADTAEKALRKGDAHRVEAERLRALVIEVARRGGVYLAFDGGPSGKPRLPQGPAEEGVVEALAASHKVEMEDVDKLLVAAGRTEGTIASRVDALIKAANRHNVIVGDVEQALAEAGFVEGSIAERVQAALDECEGAHKALDEATVGGTRLANLAYRIRLLSKAEATARHESAKARAGADDRIAFTAAFCRWWHEQTGEHYGPGLHTEAPPEMHAASKSFEAGRSVLAEAINALAKALDVPAGTLMERVPGIAAERLVETDRVFREGGFTKGTVESRAHEVVGKLAVSLEAHKRTRNAMDAGSDALSEAYSAARAERDAALAELAALRKRFAELGTQYANERKQRQQITQDTEVGAALRDLESQIERMRAKGVDHTMAFGFTAAQVAAAVVNELQEVAAERERSPAAQREAAGAFAVALHLVKVHGGTLLDAMKGEAQRLRDRNDWRDAGRTWADAKALLAKGQRASDPPVRMEQPITVTTEDGGGATVHVGAPVIVAPLLPGEDLAPSTEQRLEAVSRSVNALAKDTFGRTMLLAERVEKLERGADPDRMLRLLTEPLERLTTATEAIGSWLTEDDAAGGLPGLPERAEPHDDFRWMEQGAIAGHHVPAEELFVCGLISTVDGSWVTVARDPNDKPPQYFTRSSGFVPLEALEQAIGEARRLWDLEDVPF